MPIIVRRPNESAAGYVLGECPFRLRRSDGRAISLAGVAKFERQNMRFSPNECGRSGWHAASVAVALLVGFGLRLYWSLLLPFNDAPEEWCHYAMVRYLVQEGRLPTLDAVPEQVPVSFPALPPLGYLASAVTDCSSRKCTSRMAAIGDWPEPSPERVNHWSVPAHWHARLGNVVVGTSALWFLYLSARWLVPMRPDFALGVLWLTAFWPELVFLSAYVNNDATALTAASALWYLWMKSARRGIRRGRAIALGATAGMAFLAKANGALILAAGLPILVAPIRRTSGLGPIGASSWILFAALLTCLPWMVWSEHHHGSWVGIPVHEQHWLRYAMAHFPRQILLGSDNWEEYFLDTFRSFWAGLGFFNLFLGPIDYLLVALACGIAIGAWLQPRVRLDPRARIAWQAAAMGSAVLVAAHVHYSMRHWYSPQGRYLAPLAFPAAAFLVEGFSRAGQSGRRARVAIALVIGLFLWLQVRSIGAEQRSNRFRQPDPAVRCRLLAYHADLPGEFPAGAWRVQGRARLDESKAVPRLTSEDSAAAVLLMPAMSGSQLGTVVIETRRWSGDLAAGFLVLSSQEPGATTERRIPLRDPDKGTVSYRIEVSRYRNEFGSRPVQIRFIPGAGAVVDFYRFEHHAMPEPFRGLVADR